MSKVKKIHVHDKTIVTCLTCKTSYSILDVKTICNMNGKNIQAEKIKKIKLKKMQDEHMSDASAAH